MTYGPYKYCSCKSPYFSDQMCPVHGWWHTQEQQFTGTGNSDTWKWYEDKNKIKELQEQVDKLKAENEALKAEKDTTDEPDEDSGPDVVLHNMEWLQESGLLWLINRQVFHPYGFALSLVFDDGKFVGVQLLGDGKDTWNFHESVDEDGLLVRARETLKPKEF